MSVRPLHAAAAGLAVLLAFPALAEAAPMTPAVIFMHAATVPKLIMLGLFVATWAAIIICVIKLRAGRKLSGGSAFLSGLRVGGPLAGLLGAAYGCMNMAVGVANLPVSPPLNVLAPGFAEALMLVTLGLQAGAVAVFCHWLVEAKIDRAVLAP
jgi:biopolymer transport protein ExbB/TolQ